MDNFSGWLLMEMPMEAGNDVGLIVGESDFFALIKNSPKLQSAIKRSNYDELENHIYGAMSTRDNSKYDCIEVDKVWARPGYGPLLYYIAMSQAGPRGLLANRVSGQVSDEAKNIWRNFESGSGSGLVKAVPLDTEGYNHHPEEYLMKKYVLIKPLDLSGFLARGKAIVGRDPNQEKMSLLLDVAESLMGERVDRIYRTDLD